MRGRLAAGWAKRASVVITGSVAGLRAARLDGDANNPGVTHYPDLQTIIPADTFSVVQGTEGKEFRYTHLVYNNGPGPAGDQAGVQPGVRRLPGPAAALDAQRRRHLVAGEREQGAGHVHLPRRHGHFHFPLATFGLYAVNPDGSLGAPVAISPKNGFCIADSYTSTTRPSRTRGAFAGSWGELRRSDQRGAASRSAGPTSTTTAIPARRSPSTGVPDGTYWFRAVTDPNNDLVEGDESNNETDVKVTITGGGRLGRPGDASQHQSAGDLDDRAERWRQPSKARCSCRLTRPRTAGCSFSSTAPRSDPARRRPARTRSTGIRRRSLTGRTGSARAPSTHRAARTPPRSSR